MTKLLTKKEVVACQFSSWYQDFRNLNSDDEKNGHNNITMKSIIIPLPKEFIDYLLTDGVNLPIGATKLSSCAPTDKKEEDGWSSDEEAIGNDHDDDDSSCDVEPQKVFHFPELNEQVTNAIEKLGGSVLPKLNWSSPKDATWVNEGTMKCQTPGDVYLLLKSSDFVMYDITHAMDDTKIEEGEVETKNHQGYELVLRKWCNLYASMEFRGFVNNHHLGMDLVYFV